MTNTVARFFTTDTGSHDPIAILGTELAFHKAKISGPDGNIVFEADRIEAPAGWSAYAVNIFASLYLRKAGVPSETVGVVNPDIPQWLQKRRPAPNCTFGAETSVLQTFWRMAMAWTYHGFTENYFATEDDARAYRDEIFWLLATQRFAPNSPQFFNTGLHWAYGIKNPSQDYYRVNPETLVSYQTPDAYEHPQTSACFINPVQDNLVGDGGIMDLWAREARLFRFGSGSGTNFSTLRAAGEPLSGGGRSSGLMSFLKIGDVAAGSIKSGGTTRRAAKMAVLNIDHPDIVEFINWKMVEESKVAYLVAGAKTTKKHTSLLQAAFIKGGANPSTNPALANAIRNAHADGMVYPMIARVLRAAEQGVLDLELPDMNTDWTGEAYATVSGQNANNSVRFSADFLTAIDQSLNWTLHNRTNPDITKTIPATELWDNLCFAAWATGDPGVQFDDTINDWHTCAETGRINASNPCSEYMFLDSTSCNLGTLNLMNFRTESGAFDVNAFQNACRLTTITLEMTVGMSHYPSRAIAENSFKYRPLGLNFTNLGGVLMASGIPYDSDEGREFAGAVTALMTGAAYLTSAELAETMGAFDGYEQNAASMRQVIHNHASLVTGDETIGLTVVPQRLPISARPSLLDTDAIISRARSVWEQCVVASAAQGFRNAQTTLLAPNGTTGPVLDSDTMGLEPDFSLLKFKSLAGGGMVKLRNRLITPALEALGYSPAEIEAITAWTDQKGTPEGCPALNPRHVNVFDCANHCGNGEPPTSPTHYQSKRALSPMAHLLMMAACQPFLSGAISKTVNMPASATIQDVSDVYRAAHSLGLKAIALYRDESKLSQPVTGYQIDHDSTEPPSTTAALPVNHSNGRAKLPSMRRGHTQKFTLDGHRFYLTTGEYIDGRLGEIFLQSHRDGAAFRAVMNGIAMSVSIGLQHGVPLEEYVDAFVFTKFEPMGPVQDHDHIKMATSVLDMEFRHLAIHYLGRTDLAHVMPATISNTDKPDNPEFEIEHVETNQSPKPIQNRAHEAKRMGYEGEACGNCGNFTLVRAGTCLKCTTCGTAAGCS